MKRFLSLAALMAIAGAASADVNILVDTPINGDAPAGPAPYLKAVLQDVAPNTVKLTISNMLSGSQYVPVFLLNVNASGPLSFSYVGGQAAESISYSKDGYNGSPSIQAGLLDIMISYAITAASGDRFTGGETSVYTISGSGLSSRSFLTTSVPDGTSAGGYLAAAKVQGIPMNGGAEGSGSVGGKGAVPEPASLATIGVGLIALARRRRK